MSERDTDLKENYDALEEKYKSVLSQNEYLQTQLQKTKKEKNEYSQEVILLTLLIITNHHNSPR